MAIVQNVQENKDWVCCQPKRIQDDMQCHKYLILENDQEQEDQTANTDEGTLISQEIEN